MTARLVGYRVGKSKNTGKSFCLMHIVRPSSPRDANHVGDIADTVFTPENQVNLLKPADIGKELDLTYEYGGGGRAYLVDITVLN